MSRRHGIAVGILLLGVGPVLGLSGCGSMESTVERRSLYVDEHPELSETMAEAILAEQIQLGMTTEMVEVAWGKPSRMETVHRDGVGAMWVYGNYFVGRTITNLYFDPDNVLVRYEVKDQQTAASGASPDPPTTNTDGATTPGEISKGPGGEPPR